jgi:hypothetical protein
VVSQCVDAEKCDKSIIIIIILIIIITTTRG